MAILALLSVSAVVVRAQTPPPAKEAAPEPLVTLELKQATLADVVEALGKQYRLNILADAYLNDLTLPHVKVEQVPLGMAVSRLAALYQRQVFSRNGVLVLRHHRWHLRREQERFRMRPYRVTWTTPGRILVEDAEKPTSSSATKPVRGAARFFPFLHVEARDAPVHRTLEIVSQSCGWAIRLDPAHQERRMSAYLSRVTPGQLVESVTLLLFSGQEVLIGQSPSQKREEARLLAEATDSRSEREKLSDELTPDLLNLLSPKQREKLARGEEVALPLNSLPEGIRERALEYVQVRMDGLIKSQPDFADKMDRSRLSDFSVVLLPSPSTVIGVNGFSKDGRFVGF
jgi:hypothetical protein